MNFIIIVLYIVIIFLLYLVYRYLIVFSHVLVTNLYLKSGHPNIPLNKLKIKDYGTYNIEFWIYVNSLPSTDLAFSFSNNNYYGYYNITNNSKGCIFQTSSGNLSLDLYSNNVLTFYNGRNITQVDGNVAQARAEVETARAEVETARAEVALKIQNSKNPELSITEGERNSHQELINEANVALASANLTFTTAQTRLASANAIVFVPGQAKPSALTNNFAVQKWTYVIVSITNNSLVELYINGKLVQSSIYNGPDAINKIVKPLSTESLQFGKQLDAYITELYINPNAIDSTTAWNNYLSGNVSISKLNANLMLTQDGKNSNKIQLL